VYKVCSWTLRLVVGPYLGFVTASCPECDFQQRALSPVPGSQMDQQRLIGHLGVPTHNPLTQWSFVVHLLLSLHEVPFGRGTGVQMPAQATGLLLTHFQ
jgi:hypothetical protein